MNLNQPSLTLFELERRKNNFIPPDGSNSFYNIGSGVINLKCLRADINNYRFDLSIYSDTVTTGDGNFIISGDIIDNDHPYNKLTVDSNTTLVIDHILTISKGTMEVYGTVEILGTGQLIVRDKGQITFHSESKLIIWNESTILVAPESLINIYGFVNVHLSKVDTILNNSGIYLDSAAVMEVDGINLKDRPYSLTQYDSDLRDTIINIHTQGEYNYGYGRIGYNWNGGTPVNKSQIIKMLLLWGEAILGDFKFSVLGIPETDVHNLQIVSDLIIYANTTLYITETYRDNRFIKPDLYLGIIIGNNNRPAVCINEGTIIVTGINSRITLDRGGRLYIRPSSVVKLENLATIRSTNNGQLPVLFIDGTLILDNLDQLVGFNHDNIKFGDTGKIIILNNNITNDTIMFDTPNGLLDTYLNKLFGDRYEHIEYHMTEHCGINIDQFYEFFARDFKNWYGGKRIEQVVYDKWIIWHDNAFIQCTNEIIPWANEHCTLYDAAKLFKSFASYDDERLQEVVNRLIYAGFGNIRFKFIKNNYIKQLTLALNGCNMESVLSFPSDKSYLLKTDGPGDLFIQNKISEINMDTVINHNSTILNIPENELRFQLE